MSFAERHGLVKEKTIQMADLDETLRNRLYNAIHKNLDTCPYIGEYLVNVVDKLGHRVNYQNFQNWSIINMKLLRTDTKIPWYMAYETIELFFKAKKNVHGEILRFQNLSEEINQILKEEKSGYRLLGGQFVNIISEVELEEISKATNSPYESVNIHLRKAITLYSDRKTPDYENSIKESISAVEAMCCIITDTEGAQATLGNTLKKLEQKGIVIHSAMKGAFEKLYGYASNSDGIRHGGIDFTNAPSEDAKYMLVSCSAFVNYLIEKYSKLT